MASETVAFDIIGAEHAGEVAPGEMVIIDDRGLRRVQMQPPRQELRCVFETIYFARPDSFLYGSPATNSETRKEYGRQLWREHPVEADVVVPVPDSSTFAALGFSQESGIPFDYGLIRSHYIGRTFIEPTQAIRDAKVRKKYNPNRSVLKGKRVVLVEDSIVRGTTLRNLVRLMRDFGAREVHVRVSSPPTGTAATWGSTPPRPRGSSPTACPSRGCASSWARTASATSASRGCWPTRCCAAGSAPTASTERSASRRRLEAVPRGRALLVPGPVHDPGPARPSLYPPSCFA